VEQGYTRAGVTQELPPIDAGEFVALHGQGAYCRPEIQVNRQVRRHGQ
jgi:hypothetical protein